MSEVFGRVSEASVLFNDFKASFRLSEYYVVDANDCPQDPDNVEPELQLENFPKKVIITQVSDRFRSGLMVSIFIAFPEGSNY